MDYYCEICDKYVKPMSKNKPFKSNLQTEIDKCTHIVLSLKDIDENIVD